MTNFIDWYQLYPRKMARKDAEKAWKQLSAQDQEAAMEALPNHIKYWQLNNTDKEFIPYPASYLRGYRFEDDLDLTSKEPKKPPELPFYATEELTLKKAQEVGITPYAGEGWQQLRARISNKIKELQNQL